MTDLLSRDGLDRSTGQVNTRMQAAGIVGAFRVAMRAFLADGGSLVEHLQVAYERLAAPLLPRQDALCSEIVESQSRSA